MCCVVCIACVGCWVRVFQQPQRGSKSDGTLYEGPEKAVNVVLRKCLFGLLLV